MAAVTGGSTLTYTDTGNTATTPAPSPPATNNPPPTVTKIIAGAGITVTPVDGTGDVTVNATPPASAGVTSLKQTGNPTALIGDISLEQGAGMALTEDTVNKKITFANAGVTGLRQQGATNPLVGDVKLDSGTGITLTQDAINNKIIIAASGGS